MFKFKKGNWGKINEGRTKAFICWNCGKEIASEKYYCTSDARGHLFSFIYVCHHCNAPLILDEGNKQILLPLPGVEIKKLPENIEKIYFEIRKSIQSGCFNGAVMLMRKLIMHIAVEEGADEGKSFVEYINFLCAEGIVHKKSAGKADSIRTLGNDANHKIEDRTPEEAQNCFEFIELLLKANYEFADEEEKEKEE